MNGYVFVLDPTHPNAMKHGYVAEHVKVAAAKIGRAILPHETVHHINEIKSDNRPDNLVVMTRAEHVSHHHRGRMKPASLANLKKTRGHTSDEMRAMWRTSMAWRRREPRPCQLCGKPYMYSTGLKQKYCSRKCGHESRRKHH